MGKRALVIDDSRAMRRVIANILTERGFEKEIKRRLDGWKELKKRRRT